MLGAKSQLPPMMSYLLLTQDGSIVFHYPAFYRSIINVFQYVTITWPKITYFVNKVCKYMHQLASLEGSE